MINRVFATGSGSDENVDIVGALCNNNNVFYTGGNVVGAAQDGSKNLKRPSWLPPVVNSKPRRRSQ